MPVQRTPPAWKIPPDELDVARARAWIRQGKKIALAYLDSENRETERVIWPIVVGYHDAVRILIGWCELRRDFRNFRIDRVASATFMDERFPGRPSISACEVARELAERETAGKSEIHSVRVTR